MPAVLLMLSFPGEGESLQTDEGANEGACPSFLLAYIISPLGVDEEEDEEGEERERERRESQIREKRLRVQKNERS